MNAGAACATGDLLVFLHADTSFPPGVETDLAAALGSPPRGWGRFDVAFDPARWYLAIIACCMNLRSRLSGIATGDQAIFVDRRSFEAVGGFPDIPLMEDIALSRALRSRSRPQCLRARVVTSGRKWIEQGAIRTVLVMWRLRLAYALGGDPRRLHRLYYRS